MTEQNAVVNVLTSLHWSTLHAIADIPTSVLLFLTL